MKGEGGEGNEVIEKERGVRERPKGGGAVAYTALVMCYSQNKIE